MYVADNGIAIWAFKVSQCVLIAHLHGARRIVSRANYLVAKRRSANVALRENFENISRTRHFCRKKCHRETFRGPIYDFRDILRCLLEMSYLESDIRPFAAKLLINRSNRLV